MRITDAAPNALKSVISFYKDNTMMYHEYDSQKNCLLAGTPLTVKSAKKIFQFVNDIGSDFKLTFNGIIPSNVLWFVTDKLKIVWYTPGENQNLIFDKGLKQIKSGNYPVPPMVWQLTENNLSVFAVKGKPESEETQLYKAPFFNTFNDGKVCMGNAKYKKPKTNNYADIISYCENGFWNSIFTHTIVDDLLQVNISQWMSDNLGKQYGDGMFDDLLVKSDVEFKSLFQS